MKLSLTYTGKAIFIVALLLAAMLVIPGCSEIKPYSPSNHREEGPAKGLFTGSHGEWVIVGPNAPKMSAAEDKNGAAESEANREGKKDSGQPADRQ